MKKTRISVGIPAYNEELNIKFLIMSLFEQKLAHSSLDEIIILSDGSTDETISIVKSINDKRIKLIASKKRAGKLEAQNKILKLAKGDVLVILDADVLPIGDSFLTEIIKPFSKDNKVGLVGGATIPAKSTSFFERVISDSHSFKYDMFKQINGGNNIYLCHGRARAFSRTLYSSIVWPKFPPEDAYSYLYAVKNGYKFVFAPKAKIMFRSPGTFKDHLKQSQRFFKGKDHMKKYFSESYVGNQYKIPRVVMLTYTFKYLFKKPLTIPIYFLLVLICNSLFFNNKYLPRPNWDVSISSKKLIYEKT